MGALPGSLSGFHQKSESCIAKNQSKIHEAIFTKEPFSATFDCDSKFEHLIISDYMDQKRGAKDTFIMKEGVLSK